ncbi:toxin-antitoxin system [Lactobacillus sp. PV037]|uniref:toxin-antitoxin system n=1 Tax=unclassified Lactobacillus TaxID=2620435 RepID=UPI00223EDBBA|nr:MULTISPECIES: toxin-antitoxin system [unclassified Lactobacillus]QNQ81659.1 toxin-antitoxin system [Lactobacillus sp. PV012]QNQ84294.1 toxin-antitoxin system [Lactobacillus sp. PV037]
MVAIPKAFNISSGTKLRPKLTKKGIFYEFVEADDFFDFDEEILKDLISQGYEGNELIKQFRLMKNNIPLGLEELESEARKTSPLSKEQAMKEFGLQVNLGVKATKKS